MVSHCNQDHATDLVGEQLGVLVPDERAVGEAEVVEFLASGRLADSLEILCDAGSVHMVGELTALLDTAGGEGFVVFHELVELGVGLREERGAFVIQVDVALERSRSPDTARIYGDCKGPLSALHLFAAGHAPRRNVLISNSANTSSLNAVNVFGNVCVVMPPGPP